MPAVRGHGENQMIAVRPDNIEHAVRADRASETFDGAVVVSRKAAHVVDFHGVRPGLALVARTHELNLGIGNGPARPPNIEAARIRAMAIIGNDVRLILPRYVFLVRRFVGLLGGGNVFGFPGFAAVERAPHVNPISRGVVAPVAECSELVERNVTNESVTLIVEGRRYVSRNTVGSGLDARGDLPGTTRIGGIRSVSVVLIDGDNLLWIIGIDGDAGLGEVSGLRSQRRDAGVRSFGRELGEGVSYD